MEGHELLNFVYPNDHVHWTTMIVLYPYITGLVAGAFVLSSLYHVFGRKELRPVAKLSLVGAFAFLMFATLPLLNHLGHPERAFNIMITPNPRSAMAGFGFIYLGYTILVTVEIWFVFRPLLVKLGQTKPGIVGALYRAASLWIDDVSPEALAIDHKFIGVLAAIGIPAACILHGYVGFLFGAIKANPWWSTALMPVIFLLSAIVSGIAIVTIMYLVMNRFRGRRVDPSCLRTLVTYLWGFLIVDVSLEGLEVLNHAYESLEDWGIIKEMMSTRIGYSFFGVQFLIGSVLPLLLLGWVVLRKKSGKMMELVAYFASVLLMVQVLAMRWNVVIGGQLFSKSLRGFVDFHLEPFEREGPVVGLVIFVLPFIVLWALMKILPMNDHAQGATPAVKASEPGATRDAA